MSDLDDFFAKKDKTRRNKKKGLSNDDLDKKFEAKISEKSREKFTSNMESFIQDEGEWNDFKDESDKDYSGLKIQALSMKDKEEEQREEEESIKKEQIEIPWKVDDEKAEGGEAENKPKKPASADETMGSILMAFSGRRLPRINDNIEFPGLGTPKEAYEEPKGFQTVRTSGVNKPNSGNQNESISTDNKYNALRNNSN